MGCVSALCLGLRWGPFPKSGFCGTMAATHIEVWRGSVFTGGNRHEASPVLSSNDIRLRAAQIDE